MLRSEALPQEVRPALVPAGWHRYPLGRDLRVSVGSLEDRARPGHAYDTALDRQKTPV